MSHKKRDWSKYNNFLINRGSLTFWIHKKALKSWRAKKQKGKKGAPFIFSDTVIETAMTIKFILKLSYRTLEGYLKSLLKILGIDLPVPSYTQICKRMKKLKLPGHLLKNKTVRHVVVDATGLKVYGEGGWKVKKHGAGRRREWRKLHLAVDEETQEILFADLTDDYTSDTKFVPEIMKERCGVKRFLMDGAADVELLYKLAYESGIDLLTPPKKNAKKRSEPWLQDRTKRLLEILNAGPGPALRPCIMASHETPSNKGLLEVIICRIRGQRLNVNFAPFAIRTTKHRCRFRNNAPI
jgi:hypothetical protein